MEDALNEKRRELTEKEGAYVETKSELEKHFQIHSDVLRELELALADKVRLEQELDSERISEAVLLSQIEELKQELLLEKEESTAQQQACKDSRTALNAAEDKVKTLENAYLLVRTDLEKVHKEGLDKSLDAEKDQLRSQVTDLQHRYDQMVAQRDDALSSIVKLRETISMYTSIISLAENREKEHNLLHQKNIQLQESLSKKQEEFSVLLEYINRLLQSSNSPVKKKPSQQPAEPNDKNMATLLNQPVLSAQFNSQLSMMKKKLIDLSGFHYVLHNKLAILPFKCRSSSCGKGGGTLPSPGDANEGNEVVVLAPAHTLIPSFLNKGEDKKVRHNDSNRSQSSEGAAHLHSSSNDRSIGSQRGFDIRATVVEPSSRSAQLISASALSSADYSSLKGSSDQPISKKDLMQSKTLDSTHHKPQLNLSSITADEDIVKDNHKMHPFPNITVTRSEDATTALVEKRKTSLIETSNDGLSPRRRVEVLEADDFVRTSHDNSASGKSSSASRDLFEASFSRQDEASLVNRLQESEAAVGHSLLFTPERSINISHISTPGTGSSTGSRGSRDHLEETLLPNSTYQNVYQALRKTRSKQQSAPNSSERAKQNASFDSQVSEESDIFDISMLSDAADLLDYAKGASGLRSHVQPSDTFLR
eukprot:scaffold4209_cov160-Ochromonas_danica.AAC.1